MAKLKIKNIFFGFLRGVFYLLCIILFFIASLFIILNIPAVKDKIAKKGIEFLNQEFKTKISAEEIEVDYFGNLVFHGVAIKDHHNFDFIKAKELMASTSTLDLIKSAFNDIKIDQIRLNEPVIRVITYKEEDQDNFSVFVSKFKSEKKSEKVFKLTGRLDIINGKFSIVNQNLPKEDQVWLDTSELNLKVSNVKVVDSDVVVDVSQFNFKGKRHNENYTLKQLSGQIHYTETGLHFKDLTLESDTSLLLGYLSFTHTKENGMSNFADKVNWNLDLKQGSKISGKDLRYFVKDWDSDGALDMYAKATGTLNNLKISNPVISGSQTTYTAESLILKDLVTSDKGKSFFIETKQARLQTSYTSLKSWLPKFISSKIPEVISKLGTANYKGNFSIDKHDVAVKGDLISAIGLVQAEAELKDYSSKIPKYKGWAQTTNLNLAPFTKTSVIGPISSKINFNGAGFTMDQLDTKFNAELSKLVINGKAVNFLTASGNLKNKLFNGKITANDSHAVFSFEGALNFAQKLIKTDFEADIKKLDLKYFIPSVDLNTTVSGVIKANDLRFSNLSDLTGELNLTNVLLKREGKEDNYFDNIQIKTTSENGNRNFDIFSPTMITANIYGKYKLEDIPAMFREGIGNLLVNYKPKRTFKNQEFSFVLDVQKNLFDLLMMDVNISPGTTITGRYTGENNQLQAQLISEYIYYKNFKLFNPNIYLNTKDSINQFTGKLSSFQVNKTQIENISFSGLKRNDSLFASTKFYHGKDKDKQTFYDMNLYQTREGNDLVFGFRPSNINLVQAKWTLNPDFKSDEAIAKYNVVTGKLSLNKIMARSGEAEISLSGEYSSKQKYNFELDLAHVELERVLPKSLLQSMSFKGLANGTAKIIKTSTEFSPLIDLDINQLEFNHQALGDLSMEAIYSSTEKKYLIDTHLVDKGQERLLAKGYIENVPGKGPQINVDLTADKLNMAPIGTFLQNIFSDFRGLATGNVQITGDVANPSYQGDITMDQVGLKVNFLGVDYHLTKPQELHISDGTFFFDNIELADNSPEKNKGYVFGVLQTRNFTDWGMDLDFSTDKMMVLNTTIKQNDLFYGSVFAKGEFSINGSTSKGIVISAKAKALENSSLTINSSSTTNAADVSFIKFYSSKKSEEDEGGAEKEKVKPPLGLAINAAVSADAGSVVNLIINQQTGDRIVVRGETDNLKFSMSPAGVIAMDGKYKITGDSKYFYQIVVNKEFDIEQGSTLIWPGKGPTDAVLDITADYTRPVNNVGEYLGTNTLPTTDVTIKALLTGTLAQPDMKFNIDMNASSSIKDLLKTKLNNNPGEVYNQVAALVVFGNFLSDKMGGSSYASSAYDVVLKQLTNVINTISGNFFLNASFNAGSKVDATSDRISLDPTFKLNKRLSIIGSVNVPLDQRSEADVWTYGARIDYDISKEGNKSLIISGFSKPSTFGQETSLLGTSGANNQAYGGSVLYKKSFNKLNEVFGRKEEDKKLNKPDSTVVNKEGEK